MSDGSAPRRVETDASVRFRLPIYEGPLDLLLHLLKRAELDPHDVTASVITEQYLAWLELLDQLNLDVAGEYLVMAATLLLIKSFAMLPHPELADTEEAEELKRDLVEGLGAHYHAGDAAEVDVAHSTTAGRPRRPTASVSISATRPTRRSTWSISRVEKSSPRFR